MRSDLVLLVERRMEFSGVTSLRLEYSAFDDPKTLYDTDSLDGAFARIEGEGRFSRVGAFCLWRGSNLGSLRDDGPGSSRAAGFVRFQLLSKDFGRIRACLSREWRFNRGCIGDGATSTAYTYAGDDPVNGGDPTGLYTYQYSWYIGQEDSTSIFGPATAAFDYLANHVHQIFPFPTGNCGTFSRGEQCVFHPGAGVDHLYVKTLSSTSVTLKVQNWCQSPHVFGTCPVGDPPGSTITFTTTDWPDSLLPSSFSNSPSHCAASSSDGEFLALTQTANAPGASPLSGLGAPEFAFFTWHQQARNLAKALSFNPDNVALLVGGGLSYGLPVTYG